MSQVVILYLSYIHKKISNLLFIFINIFIISFFIPSSTRFFYPYFIILSIYLIKIILNSSESNSRIISYKKTKYLNKLIITLIITQSLILLGAVNYYNLEFINASIKNQKSEFLERKINHFDINKYLSNNVDKNKVIFTDARIRGFSKLNIANLDPLTFQSKESKFHFLEYARLKNIKFSEYIYIVNTSDSSIGNLINQCIKSKPETFYSKYKTRNIFQNLIIKLKNGI